MLDFMVLIQFPKFLLKLLKVPNEVTIENGENGE